MKRLYALAFLALFATGAQANDGTVDPSKHTMISLKRCTDVCRELEYMQKYAKPYTSDYACRNMSKTLAKADKDSNNVQGATYKFTCVTGPYTDYKFSSGSITF